MPCLSYKPTGPIHRASSEGFTLIELVIAIAIVAIIAGFAAGGGTRSWLTQRGLSTAVEQLRGDMQRAKLLAVRQHTNCTISLNTPAANQYTISLNNQVVDLGTYRGNVVFAGPSAGAVTITFTPWGTSTAAACVDAEVQMTNGGGVAAFQTGTYRLRISASGGISKEIQSGGGWVLTGV